VAGSLRSFAADDAERVVELSRATLARPEFQVGNPIWTSTDELTSELADWDPAPDDTLLVAEDEDGHIVAFGGVELPAGFDHAELFGPLVATEARGHRLGTHLLQASIERAVAGKATSLVGAVGTRNAAGRILLERQGFRKRGRPQATFRLRPEDHRPLGETPDGVVVRIATPDDLPAALELYRECFPQGRFPEAVWRDNLVAGTVYAAETEGEIVAVLNIDPSDRWIYHVGVTEAERNRGVGAVLLSRSLELFWAGHPGSSLGLDVDADNVPAIRLYRRQGFAPWLVLQTFERDLP
jgi:ribosomal protein S18 acetylase RimI-like enzyme